MCFNLRVMLVESFNGNQANGLHGIAVKRLTYNCLFRVTHVNMELAEAFYHIEKYSSRSL